jgi:hypothetical protein
MKGTIAMRESTKLVVPLGAAGVSRDCRLGLHGRQQHRRPGDPRGLGDPDRQRRDVHQRGHSYTAATDTTTAIEAKAEELLSTADGVVKVSINN